MLCHVSHLRRYILYLYRSYYSCRSKVDLHSVKNPDHFAENEEDYWLVCFHSLVFIFLLVLGMGFAILLWHSHIIILLVGI